MNFSSYWPDVISSLRHVADVMPEAAAAAAGAYFAFMLQRRHEAAKKREDEADALRSAWFGLIRKRDWLIRFKTDILAPHTTHPVRFLAVRPAIQFPQQSETDFSRIGCLMRAKGSAAVLSDVYLADRTFASIFDIAAHHRELAFKAQAKMAESSLAERGILYASQLTAEDAVEILGGVAVLELQQATDMLYGFIDVAIDKNRTAAAGLITALSTHYPGENVPKSEEVPQPQVAPSHPHNQAANG